MPDSATLIFQSGRCEWGNCFFCGYGRLIGDKPTQDNLKRQFDEFLFGLDGDVDGVKIFGSGSFLDEKQVPNESRKIFLEKLKEKGILKLTVESRPEFVSNDALKEFMGFDYSIAIGLEVADDDVLEKINKGFKLKDFERAAKTIHDEKGKVRTYLLVNPPFIEDVAESINSSVEYALKHSDSIVLINLLPHGNTPLFSMWLSGEWNFLSKKEFAEVTEKWRGNEKITLDEETFRFTPKFPKNLKDDLKGVGEQYLTHPHFEVWQDYLQRWYQPLKEKKILLFLPCSYTKPYSNSKTHQNIIKIISEAGIRRVIHEVMLSNAGVIPREFENHYPFESYDWDERLEMEEIKKRYVEVTSQRIKGYLKAHTGQYKKLVCFLKPDSDSYKALEDAALELGISVHNLLTSKTYSKLQGTKSPLQDDLSLNDLKKGLNWLLQDST
ncbi:MAG: DUF5591 domain-containing protein [Candidatus Altiarchaeota archaeon]